MQTTIFTHGSLPLTLSAAAIMLCTLSACNVYDEPTTNNDSSPEFSIDETHPERMTLKIDAQDFGEWTYVSLKNKHVEKLPIPLTCEGQWDGISGISYQQVNGNEYTFISSLLTDAQSEPEEWDFALHRFDVRTNCGAVSETTLTSIDDVDILRLESLSFTEDVWSTTIVMTDISAMMSYRIGYQNIKVNPVLSDWVKMDISTPPPTFIATGSVYVLQLSNGEMAAMRMRSYVNELGEKGHLTIDIIYPLQ